MACPESLRQGLDPARELTDTQPKAPHPGASTTNRLTRTIPRSVIRNGRGEGLEGISAVCQLVKEPRCPPAFVRSSSPSACAS